MSVNKRLPNGTLQPIAGLGTYDLNDLKQYTTLPTASSANEGLVVQYVGTDSSTYSIGGMYQCQEDSGSYAWVLLSQEIEVDDAILSTSENPVQNKVIKTALDGKVNSSAVGSANGVAQLDNTGKVPISQLPATMSMLEKYATRSLFPATGDDNTLYVALDTNYTYRWTGADYVQIDESIQLGETATTAYRGDRGKVAYDHATDSSRLTTAQSSGLYKIATTAEGHVASVSAVQKSDITALGIPSSDTTYSSKAASSGGTDVSLCTTGEKYTWNNKVSASAISNMQEQYYQSSEPSPTKVGAVWIG